MAFIAGAVFDICVETIIENGLTSLGENLVTAFGTKAAAAVSGATGINSAAIADTAATALEVGSTINDYRKIIKFGGALHEGLTKGTEKNQERSK